MADNSLRTPGSGETIASDDITDGGVANGAKAQRIKIGIGADNAYKDVLPPADGMAQANAVPSAAMLYNETTGFSDMERSVQVRTALASSARTATTLSANQTNYNHRGIFVTLDITVASGTGGLLLRLLSNDTGTSARIWESDATPATTVSRTTYAFYPGIDTTQTAISSGSGLKKQISTIVPRTFLLQVVAGDASSYTYSLVYSIL